MNDYSLFGKAKNGYRFIILAFLLLSLHYVSASDNTIPNLTPSNYVDLSGVETLYDGCPAMTFVVNVTCEDSYIPSFLINVKSLPADNKVNVYDLVVNGKRVCEITTEELGLQIIRPDEPKVITLNKGENSIGIVSKTFEYPNVATLRLSMSEYDSSGLLDIISDTQSSLDMDLLSLSGQSIKPKNYYNVSESYYTIMQLEEGTLLALNLSTSVKSIVDLVLISGGSNEKEYMSMSAISTYNMLDYGKVLTGMEDVTKYKNYILTTLPITKTGRYFLTIRPVIKSLNGVVSGVINVSGKKENTYDRISSIVLDKDFAFFSNQYDLSIPADGKKHIVYAKGTNAAKSDLMMLVYGGYSDNKHIVEYNDNDATGSYIKLGGTYKDACVSMSPHRDTSFIRLFDKNYAMTVLIYSDLLGNWPNSGTSGVTKNKSTNTPALKSCDLRLSSTCEFNDVLVSDIYISDISGLIVSERHFTEPCGFVSLSELGINKPGRYIFTMVSDSNQTNSQQVQIKE